MSARSGSRITTVVQSKIEHRGHLESTVSYVDKYVSEMTEAQVWEALGAMVAK